MGTEEQKEISPIQPRVLPLLQQTLAISLETARRNDTLGDRAALHMPRSENSLADAIMTMRRLLLTWFPATFQCSTRRASLWGYCL